MSSLKREDGIQDAVAREGSVSLQDQVSNGAIPRKIHKKIKTKKQTAMPPEVVEPPCCPKYEFKRLKDKKLLTVVHKSIEKSSFHIPGGEATVSLKQVCEHLLDEDDDYYDERHMFCDGTMQPLSLALEKQNYKIAHLLLNSGADVTLVSKDSLPIHYALEDEHCQVPIIKAIIEAGFPVNAVVHIPTQRTSLHSSVLTNNLSVSQYLLSIKANPNVKDNMGLTPLHYAVQKNYPEIVILLVKYGAVLDCISSENITPMFYAIAMDNCKMMDLLLSLGANIDFVVNMKNSKTGGELTPLHFAASICKFKTVQLLVKKGADVNKVTPTTKETPLHTAARAEIDNSRESKIALPCIVELLIKHNADLNKRQQNGLTPLQIALQCKNVSIAKILIIHGSALNNKLNENDDKSHSTFHLAAKCFDKDLIKLCFDYGANWDISDKNVPYPAYFALMSAVLDSEFCSKPDKQEIFNLFWRKGFLFDVLMNTHWVRKHCPTVPQTLTYMLRAQKLLFKGVMMQQQAVVKKALMRGADPQGCCKETAFPIHFIASKGNYEILKCFLSKGVNTNSLNKQRESALHLAAKEGHTSCCQLLLEYGACYNYRAPICLQTPAEVAKANGHVATYDLLKKVDKYFRGIKRGLLSELKKEYSEFNAIMNCQNRQGLTLLALALNLGKNSLAEKMMSFRLYFDETDEGED